MVTKIEEEVKAMKSEIQGTTEMGRKPGLKSTIWNEGRIKHSTKTE